jgi:hypothetical protein
MKLKILLITFSVFTIILSCKSDKQNPTKPVTKNTEDKLNSFEESLLDYRKINVNFNPNYNLISFGVKKHNDSIYSYVFGLNNEIKNEEVLAHSIGIKAYSHELLEDKEYINKGFAPQIEIKENKKFLILKQNFSNIKYIDSLEAFIFTRKNYKASGKLGTVKVYDILLEDE